MPDTRKHILNVVRTGRADGGMERGIINIADHLPNEFRVSVCALDSEETFSQRMGRKDVEYYLLPKSGAGIDWSLIWRLARLFQQIKVDLVHSHNWGTFIYAVMAAAWARLPVVHGEHGGQLALSEETHALKLRTKRMLSRRIDRLVTVNPAMAEEWAAYGMPPHKIAWIPNGVDVDRFRPRADVRQLRRRFNLPEDGFIVGTVARLDPIKQQDILVEAFARLACRRCDCHLAFMGDGPSKEKLRNLAHRLGIAHRISWLGKRHDPELFLPALDVFAFPSLSEGMPFAVLEAMASGVPVVCSDLLGHRILLEKDDEGILIHPCNPQSLAEALDQLFQNRDRRHALANAARKKVLAQFNMSRMVAEYARLYRQVCMLDNLVPNRAAITHQKQR